MSKDKASSPNVSLEAMMLSSAIDVKEDRYVILADILGAFYMYIWMKTCT